MWKHGGELNTRGHRESAGWHARLGTRTRPGERGALLKSARRLHKWEGGKPDGKPTEASGPGGSCPPPPAAPAFGVRVDQRNACLATQTRLTCRETNLGGGRFWGGGRDNILAHGKLSYAVWEEESRHYRSRMHKRRARPPALLRQ